MPCNTVCTVLNQLCMMANADWFVGTYSSNVGRRVIELMGVKRNTGMAAGLLLCFGTAIVIPHTPAHSGTPTLRPTHPPTQISQVLLPFPSKGAHGGSMCIMQCAVQSEGFVLCFR